MKTTITKSKLTTTKPPVFRLTYAEGGPDGLIEVSVLKYQLDEAQIWLMQRIEDLDAPLPAGYKIDACRTYVWSDAAIAAAEPRTRWVKGSR